MRRLEEIFQNEIDVEVAQRLIHTLDRLSVRLKLPEIVKKSKDDLRHLTKAQDPNISYELMFEILQMEGYISIVIRGKFEDTQAVISPEARQPIQENYII